MVDRLANEEITRKQKIFGVIIPAIFLGITTSIRVLGPLAGLVLFIYFLAVIRNNKDLRASVSPWLVFLIYAGISILAMIITWPFLWENPVARFLEVFHFMSDNPTELSVLFDGTLFRAGELPRRYLPYLLGITLTEPVWLLFIIGIAVGYLKFFRGGSDVNAKNNLVTLSLVLFWFLIIVVYVLIRKPAMYDGWRHFLFIIPPIFIFTGFAFEFILRRITPHWLRAVFIAALLLPGVIGIIQLHPYEYAYYNSFIGGTSGAFRQYETDYWLTCYKEAVEQFENENDEPAKLFVHREAYIAAYYADADLQVQDTRGALKEIQSGDYVLINTRANEDRGAFKEAKPVLHVGRGDAIFCIIKQIP
jgi:hypothetical protein